MQKEQKKQEPENIHNAFLQVCSKKDEIVDICALQCFRLIKEETPTQSILSHTWPQNILFAKKVPRMDLELIALACKKNKNSICMWNPYNYADTNGSKFETVLNLMDNGDKVVVIPLNSGDTRMMLFTPTQYEKAKNPVLKQISLITQSKKFLFSVLLDSETLKLFKAKNSLEKQYAIQLLKLSEPPVPSERANENQNISQTPKDKDAIPIFIQYNTIQCYCNIELTKDDLVKETKRLFPVLQKVSDENLVFEMKNTSDEKPTKLLTTENVKKMKPRNVIIVSISNQ